MTRTAVLLTLAMSVMTSIATAQNTSEMRWTLGKITIKDPWALIEPAGGGGGKVYLSIRNNSDQLETLLTIDSSLAGSAVLRGKADGARLDRSTRYAQPLPPWSEVTLKPGSLHVALTNVSPDAKRLKAIPLRLTFERSGVLDILVPIVLAGSTESMK